MALADCEKCGQTPCECGHMYKDWTSEKRMALVGVLLKAEQDNIKPEDRIDNPYLPYINEETEGVMVCDADKEYTVSGLTVHIIQKLMRFHYENIRKHLFATISEPPQAVLDACNYLDYDRYVVIRRLKDDNFKIGQRKL